MAEQLVRKFDRRQWLATRDILARTTIFLDLRFWIGMSEEREHSYIELKRVAWFNLPLRTFTNEYKRRYP